MEDTLYRHILKDAWNITWKNKLFWLLGFLAVFWGDIGAYQSLNQVLENVGPILPAGVSAAGSLLPPFEGLNIWGFISMMLFALVLLAIIAVFVIIVTAGRGGLLLAIAKLKGKETITVGTALQKGARAFLPLLGIGILARLDVLLYVFLLTPIAAGPADPIRAVFFVLLFVVLTIVSLILSLLGVYASLLVMLDGLSLPRAIRDAIRIFAKHWLVSLELALILYFITLVAGLAVVLVFFIVGIPFLFVGILLSLLHLPGALWIVIIPAVVIYVVALLLLGSAFVTFQYSAWTLLFLRLRSAGAVAKVVRLTSRFGHILHRKIA